jgi:inosine-uridine nucleoside N-ribohydrolase
MTEKVLCDCDNTMGLPGKPIDDGQTLLYLLGRPDIDLLGITTSFGNGTIDEVREATEHFLQAYGRPDIPAYHGAGRRGQGPTGAAHFLAETVAAHPGEITLLAIGPLGNLRAAAEIDPAFFQNLKQIVCMGGYLHALELPGWEHVSELNLASDPEAAFAALNAPCPFTLMNAHICLQAPFGLEELAPIEQHDPRTYQLLKDYLLVCASRHLNPRDYLWDLLPAVYISYPNLFDDNPVWVASTLADLETGTIIPGRVGEGANINMPTRILDLVRFYQLLYEAWSRAPVYQG